jgi:hypothetical protein
MLPDAQHKLLDALIVALLTTIGAATLCFLIWIALLPTP